MTSKASKAVKGTKGTTMVAASGEALPAFSVLGAMVMAETTRRVRARQAAPKATAGVAVAASSEA